MLYCANVEIIIQYTTKMKLPVLAGSLHYVNGQGR